MTQPVACINGLIAQGHAWHIVSAGQRLTIASAQESMMLVRQDQGPLLALGQERKALPYPAVSTDRQGMLPSVGAL